MAIFQPLTFTACPKCGRFFHEGKWERLVYSMDYLLSCAMRSGCNMVMIMTDGLCPDCYFRISLPEKVEEEEDAEANEES